MRRRIFNCILTFTCSVCREVKMGETGSLFLVLVGTRAAALTLQALTLHDTCNAFLSRSCWADVIARTMQCEVWNLTPLPLLLSSAGGTSPSCHWSSATCWLSWRPSSPMVCFRVTTSASLRQMQQSSGDVPLETSELNSILLSVVLNPWSLGGYVNPQRHADLEDSRQRRGYISGWDALP